MAREANGVGEGYTVDWTGQVPGGLYVGSAVVCADLEGCANESVLDGLDCVESVGAEGRGRR